ncbi:MULTISPECIES: site-specific DNA-methyltransferase [Acinetobacter calcoaceticus/baumannii complex]|uniref:site-specific DNA-methyltransferase n=1 Tax=Acinetobacter calcoaceticus/baumannii complex TaxID=909768 RepID=UPI00124F768E|nr:MULTISPECIES: site-specific DNA-methyltransferase [Acinetobacter calcoaceticus/baumannii complex]MCQ1045744.1 site-specific DNA-methyltransferase [Acinetobacter baumannii]
MKTEQTLPTEKITANSEQLAVLKNNFPQCFDKQGKFLVSKLQEILQADGVDVSRESYSLNWLGKSYARVLANEPIRTMLSEDIEHNQQEQNKNSHNLLIQGDNLEVLKHLKGAYSEKIKMIYIDPPYNTGSDGFVYQDDRSFTPEQFAALAGVDLEEAKRVLDFTQSNANSHSAWLTFIYPRLYIAKQLLKDDGVIFISIDENEQSQLKFLCDEIFGESNFIECITWNKRIPKNDKGIGNIHEYILVYTKNSTEKKEFIMPKHGLDDIYEYIDKLKRDNIDIKESEKQLKKFYKKQSYDRGITLYNNLDDNYELWGKINLSWPNANTVGDKYDVKHPLTGENVKVPERGWRWVERTFDKESGRVNGEYTDVQVLHDGSVRTKNIWFARDENTQPSSIKYLKDVEYFLLRSIISLKSDGGQELERIFGKKSVFPYPKPTSLIKTLLFSLQVKNDDIILDFFGGSGTTGQAVHDYNVENNTKVSFILVQLDEEIKTVKENKESLNFCTQNSLRPNVFELTKYRLNSVFHNSEELVGFKIFKTCDNFFPTSNYRELKQLTLSQSDTLPATTAFDKAQLQDILTTWKGLDKILLSENLNTVSLGDYLTYSFGHVLYLVNKGFNTDALKDLIQKLDDEHEFQVSKLVILGHHFDSKSQREIDEAMKNYNNKKSIPVDVVVRY